MCRKLCDLDDGKSYKKRHCPQASHSLRSSRPVPREGATVSFLGLPWCAWRSGSSMRRTACLPSQGEQVPEAGGLLATTFSAVMASTSRSSSLEKVAVCCPASFRLPQAVSASTGKGRRWSVVRRWSRRHRTSVAQEGGMTMGSTWTEDGKRLEAGPIVGWRRLCTRPPGRSKDGFPSLGTIGVRASHDI